MNTNDAEDRGSCRKIDIAVIGGGASGMVSAISAQRTFAKLKQNPCSVTVFERNDRVGKKLLMTGNGRCNLTNLDADMLHYHGSDVRFAKGALLRYPPSRIISFFEELGLVCTVEDNSKVYPLSLHASSVLDSLRLCLQESQIDVITDAQVIRVEKTKNEFILTLLGGQKYLSKCVIVAAGGMCAPVTGSDGNGYNLLEHFSHKLITPVPSIVQLKTDTKMVKPLSGNKIQGRAALYIGSRKIREESGEILFTDYGLSGPPILQLSGYVSRAQNDKKSGLNTETISVSIDFLPEYSLDEVKTMLFERRRLFQNRKLEEYLTGLFHRRLGSTLLRSIMDRPLSEEVSHLSDIEIEKLACFCKSLEIKVTGTMMFANAQTTSGGIQTSNFSASTLSSANCPGLFACGEILDIDGDCGGYNLQWAWASGMLAGSSAAKYCEKEIMI